VSGGDSLKNIIVENLTISIGDQKQERELWSFGISDVVPPLTISVSALFFSMMNLLIQN